MLTGGGNLYPAGGEGGRCESYGSMHDGGNGAVKFCIVLEKVRILRTFWGVDFFEMQ
jgi:hypothetical protein